MKIIIINSLILLFQYNLAYTNSEDSSNVIIKKGTGKTPTQYNISDIMVKRSSKINNLYILRVNVEIPGFSMLKVRITDSLEQEKMFLVKDKRLNPGIYIIQWQMANYDSGMYWCEFETEHFIYRKDFYLKK